MIEFTLMGLPKPTNRLTWGHWATQNAHNRTWKRSVSLAIRAHLEKLPMHEVLPEGITKEEADESLFSRFEPVGECWMFIGPKDSSGYGSLSLGGTRYRAHRLSYILRRTLTSSLDVTAFVLHRCDNPSCIRPDHLFLGTQKDNMQDMAKKGRGTGGSSIYKRQPLQTARLTLTRYSTIEPDYDGLVSSFKPIIDGLVEAGFLAGDKRANIGVPDYRWEKAKRGQGRITVRIELPAALEAMGRFMEREEE